MNTNVQVLLVTGGVTGGGGYGDYLSSTEVSLKDDMINVCVLEKCRVRWI